MIQWWQILLLTLYSAYQICDELTIVSSAGSPVFAGFITGLIMGDVTTGLLIGGWIIWGFVTMSWLSMRRMTSLGRWIS
ncbi:PTS system%2C IIC component [Streptococcus pneumoniae]|nr:PTS system%2C IIC component [Streptococcus pneumoniae]